MVQVSRVARLVSVSAASTRFVLSHQYPCGEIHISLKLVDTKSVNNTTLLHFLEKTVSRHFSDMEEFLEELEKPAEAYRGQFPLNYLFWLSPQGAMQSTFKIFAKVLLTCEMVFLEFIKNSWSILPTWMKMTVMEGKCGRFTTRLVCNWKIWSMM